MPAPSRRELLLTTAAAMLFSPTTLFAAVIRGTLPFSSQPPLPDRAAPGPWQFFSGDEVAAMEAIVDRLIPADPETPGGKDVGCVVFIDRQLAGAYGSAEGHYNSAPFQKGTKQQGDQSRLPPASRYRAGLAALDRHCKETFSGNGFAALADDQKDQVIAGLESGSVALGGLDPKEFFKLVLDDTQHGFLADPVYGGNKEMAAWKMIGFPGARYDYREWIERHNERYPLPPVGIEDHPDWK